MGKDSRDTLRRIQRQLRDHYTALAEELNRSNAEALAARHRGGHGVPRPSGSSGCATSTRSWPGCAAAPAGDGGRPMSVPAAAGAGDGARLACC